MTKNKKFAFIFRLTAVLFIMFTLMWQFGVFHGSFSVETITYYTIQSNVLALVMFLMLTVRTEKDLRGSIHGNAGYFTRFRMICTVNLMLTFIIFWALLAPSVPIWYLSGFSNLSIHAIVPLLCLADYILFSETGHLRHKDAYLTCAFPLTYLSFATVAGFMGYEYGVTRIGGEYTEDGIIGGHLEAVRFPYFFMDFDVIGFWALAYIAGIAGFLILLGHLFYFIDRRLHKKRQESNVQDPSVEKSNAAKSNAPIIMIIALTVAAMLFIAAGLGSHHDSFMDRYNETYKGDYENVILRVGRYMHESGDPGMYITVYSDKTIQAVGFDYYEFSINDAEFLEELSEITEEWRESLIGRVLDLSEQYKQRGEYGDDFSSLHDEETNEVIQENMFTLTVAADENTWYGYPVFQYIDENTIGFFDGLYNYREP